MQNNLEIYFSNRLDVLYEMLKRELFFLSTPPMMRRLIVVYGPAMKTWLMLKMAQDPELDVAAGFEVIYLSQAFEHLLKLSSCVSGGHLPSHLELSLAIEKECLDALQNFRHLDNDEQSDWQPLIEYLKLDTESLEPHLLLSRKAEKRLIGLSEQMARLFQDYGRFALKMTASWELPDCPGWQPRLWRRLFKEGMKWTYPARALLKNGSPQDFTLHFFSISFITGSEFEYLTRLSHNIPVRYYLLSPCAVFWSDIRSDRESAYLQRYWQKKLKTNSPQIQTLEELLRDRNPLLANFGRMGREMACQIEESQADVKAAYVLPEHVKELDADVFQQDDLILEESSTPLSLLHAVQADLLMMRNSEGAPPVPIDDAQSIQLHIAPSKRREVEILYHNLLKLIQEDSDLTPGSIIVMAPKIGEYAPFIQSIFGSGESLIDFQLLDLGCSKLSEIVQGFLQLLDLSEGRWDAAKLLQLFGNPSFQRRHQFSANDFLTIQTWMEKAGIRWGDDWLHRNLLLKRGHCRQGMAEETPVGTWDYGVSSLLMGLIAAVDEEASLQTEAFPCSGAEFSQGELLSRWIRLLQSLRDDLTPLEDRSRMTMEDWGIFLNCLAENYFQIDFDDAQSAQEFEELKALLDLLGNSSRFFKKASYSYASVKHHLLNQLASHGMSYREDRLNAVRFCSLLPLRSIPAACIALMGMQEDAFPRQDNQSSFNLMTGRSDASYCPSPSDYDRYLFLEALHSAQKNLLLSCQGFGQKDGKEVRPSLIVEELFSYLDTFYIAQGKKASDVCIFKHPFEAFDPRYFSKGSAFANFSPHDYSASLALCHAEKSPPYRLVQAFTFAAPLLSEVLENGSQIDMRDLGRALRDPIKFHLNQTLEIFLETEEARKVKTEEEITVSPLDKYRMIQLAPKLPIDAILQRAERQGMLPFGLFKTVAAKRMKMDALEISSCLENLSIDPSDVFQIEFCSGCKEIEKLEGGRWLFPAVSLTYESGYRLTIAGKLVNATPKGLLVLEKGSLEDAWKAWPQFLLYCHAAKEIGNWEPKIIFAKSKKSKTAFFVDPIELLKQLVYYYAVCLKNFSPLIPEWISLILKEDAAALQDSMRQVFADSFSGYQNPYLSWILNKRKLPDPDAMIEEWRPLAEQLIGDLIHHWDYSKREA